MTNGNESIFPDDKDNPQFNSVHYGLTKREHFAAMAMQGMYSNNGMVDQFGYAETLAKEAVAIADALIKALNEPE